MRPRPDRAGAHPGFPRDQDDPPHVLDRSLCGNDIFFLFDYRRNWVLGEFRFWTEQYLLQAFLTFNSEFEAADGQ